MSDALISDIRDKLKKVEQPEYPDGTVIRFRVKPEGAPKRTYAALYAGKRWWTTSTLRGMAIMSDTQFFAYLAQNNVTKIQLATGWENV